MYCFYVCNLYINNNIYVLNQVYKYRIQMYTSKSHKHIKYKLYIVHIINN